MKGKNISDGHKGIKLSDSHKRKIGLANKGKIRSEEHKQNISRYRKGKKHSKETKRKMSEAQKGRVHMPHSEETKRKMSQTKKGKIPKNINQIAGWNKGKKHSEEHKKNLKKNHKGTLGKHWKMPKEHFDSIRGEKNHMWKGGVTPINKKIRRSIEYKRWRLAVFERDNYTCVWCGKKGGILNADHIKPFALFPKLRFAIDNGRTLCVDCHRKTNNYGGKKKN